MEEEHKIKKPKKNPFKFKKGRNGLILTLHNTIKSRQSKSVRIRLTNACFNSKNTNLLSIDHRGNIFAFDLVNKQFWKLLDKIQRSTILQNNQHFVSEYCIGTKDGDVFIINIENRYPIKFNKICALPIEYISFPSTSNESFSLIKYFLISSFSEAYLVDLKTLQPYFKLEFNTSSQTILKFVSFFPNSDKILTCFSNDAVHIWSNAISSNLKLVHGRTDDDDDDDFHKSKSETLSSSNLKTIRIFHPIRARDRQLKLKNSHCDELTMADEIANDSNIYFSPAGICENDDSEEITDFTRGIIKSFQFSLDGNFICLTTVDGFIILLSSITFEICKLIRMKEVNCKQCFCIGKNLGGTAGVGNILSSNDLLVFALTTTSDIVLIDCNDLLVKAIIQSGGCTYKMNLSCNGKLLFAIQKTGEINVYQTSVVVNALKAAQKNIDIVKVKRNIPASDGSVMLTKELKETLSKDRLIPILNEYGSYSNKYRHLIWNTLLELPSNKSLFVELIKKGLHPITLNYDRQFPIKDATLLRNLKKIASSLVHWSKILAECDFLPKFIFPFLKIFPNSLLLTFELLVTIFLNQCQLWFEFAPMEPLNYLGLIENALYFYDPELIEFYKNKKVTTKIYAWPLLATGFSEVLDEQQWYQLWDHIISMNVEYILFAVIAYQIIQRNVIMRLETIESIELFFHEQYIIDIKRFIRKTNNLMETCPVGLDPRRYLKAFEKLPKGYYPVFENYPKEWVDLKDKELEAIHIENYILDEKIRNLEMEEIQLAKKLEEGLKEEENQKRLKELEKLYCGAISREEERIACQRKMLLVHQKQIRNRKGKVLELVRESENRKNINLHENELDTLMRKIERRRTRDETDMMFAEENLKDRELNLLSQKLQIESKTKNENEYKKDDPYRSRLKANISKRMSEDKRKLTDEFKGKNNITVKSHSNLPSGGHSKIQWSNHITKTKTNRIEDMLEQIQMEFQRTIESK